MVWVREENQMDELIPYDELDESWEDRGEACPVCGHVVPQLTSEGLCAQCTAEPVLHDDLGPEELPF